MPTINLFSTYRQGENRVTATFLAVLQRLSLLNIDRILGGLLEEDAFSLVSFENQPKGQSTRPDARIRTKSAIWIETKTSSDAVNTDQIQGHLEALGEGERLLLLTPDADKPWQLPDDKGIIWSNFRHLVEIVDGILKDEDEPPSEREAFLLREFIKMIRQDGLIGSTEQLMRIVPCGQSLEINREYGIYFHPSDRSYTKHRFVGIYKDKTVQAIWKIESVFDVEYNGVEVKKTLVEGKWTDDYDDRLRSIINDAESECDYAIKTGHRFFCGEPQETRYEKSSRGGIQGARFQNLREVIGNDFDILNVEEIAQRLRGEQWE